MEPTKSRGRIPHHPALDGIRGIALFFMLIYHGDFSWIGGGYLSVSTFFTLSGFLITALLLVEREDSGRIDLVDFWVRRLRRLMPAALAGIALVAVFAATVATPSQISRLRWDAISSLLYFSNFRFMATGHSYWEIFSRPSPLQHYWSLSIEEQFYLLYPPLMIAVYAFAPRARSTLRNVLIALALASTCLMISLSLAGVAPARLYYGTDTRASEFLIGGVLATMLVRSNGIHPWHGRGFRVVTLVASVYVLAVVILVKQDSAFLYRGGFALYSIATAVLINAALQPSLVTSFLSRPPFPWAGAISYGTYIYHWPIYLWLDPRRTGLSGVMLLALQMGVTLLVAQLSYRYLEQPIRRGQWLRGARGTLGAPATAVAVMAALLFFTQQGPSAAPDRAMREMFATGPMPELGPPAPEGPVRVMVLGDSIAWTIGAGFDHWARHKDGAATVWNLAEYGCGLARGGETPDITLPEGKRETCYRWGEWWEAEIDRFRPDLVIILSGIWDLVDRRMDGWNGTLSVGDPRFDDWLLSEYQLAVDIASSRGAHVLWLTSPCVGPDVDQSPLAKTGAFNPERIEHLNRVILPRLAASRPRQLGIFDLFATVCPKGQFVKRKKALGELRPDDLHLGENAAAWVAGVIAAEGWRALGLPPPVRHARAAGSPAGARGRDPAAPKDSRVHADAAAGGSSVAGSAAGGTAVAGSVRTARGSTSDAATDPAGPQLHVE